jgi:transcriptional antiterminator RfaH
MPFWSVVRSLPMKERFAASQLELRGYETFLPLVQTKRASAPLFASYFFVLIVEQWRSINTCFGVLGLVRVGDCPSKMPNVEIENLKAMIDEHGYVRLPEGRGAPIKREIAIGCKVKITAGPFGGHFGLYAGQSTRDRERVLLNLLGSSRPVLIASNLVVPQRAKAHPDDARGAYPAKLRDNGVDHRPMTLRRRHGPFGNVDRQIAASSQSCALSMSGRRSNRNFGVLAK